MTFQTFYISIAVLVAAVLCGAIIVWILESKFNKKYPANQNKADIEKNSVKVSGEKVYLQVEGGQVTVIDSLPTVEVEVGVPQIKYVKVAEGDDIPVEAEEEVDTSNLVSFERNESVKRLTFADKLAALDKEDLERYHKLVNYVIAKENAKQVVTNNMAIFKIRTTRMMVATVKRGVVTLQYSLGDSNLERFVRAEGAQIKVPTVTIRLTDDTALENAKKTVDITVDHVETERNYHKELKREQRREQRAKAKAAQQAAADTAE